MRTSQPLPIRLSAVLSTFCVAAVFVVLTGALAQAPSGNVVISSNTTWASGSYQITSVTVQSGATLTVGGGSTVTVTGALVVTGNSKVVLQSINNAAQVNGTWQGTGVTVNAASVQVDAGSSINADGQGYLALAGPGGGGLGNENGGSYGGSGGGQSASTIYG